MLICVLVYSLNGQMWLPSESSVICSEHFLELKSFDDPSFVPGLFPTGNDDSMSSELQLAEKQGSEQEVSIDFDVLRKVVDRLPALSAVDTGRVGPAQGQTDTSQLEEAFRELACHLCRLLIPHDSELLIEGTVGITVDRGTRVMLLHFADVVRKTELSNVEENVQHPLSKHTVFGKIDKDNAKDGTANQLPTSICSLEEITVASTADNSTKLLPVTASSSQFSTASLKILSDLAQQTTPTSGLQTNAVGTSAHKRKVELDKNSMCDKPKQQQTLLRELLCAPLPPKRPCRPVVVTPSTTDARFVEVLRPRRQTANSTVLGGLLRMGNYQRESNFNQASSIYCQKARSNHEAGTIAQRGYSDGNQGTDVPGTQFGGNAVQALLRLASEHAVTGRYDLLRNNRHRETPPRQNDGFANDGLADASLDRRYSLLNQYLVGSCSLDCTSSSQNSRTNSSTTVSSSSQHSPSSVKQEVVDPNYE